MTHLTEEQIILHYYGEDASSAAHLAVCEQCREAYQTLQRVLNSVDSLPVPERGADYEAEVWKSIVPRMKRGRPSPRYAPFAIAASIAILILTGYLSRTPKPKPVVANNDAVRERVLLVAVGDHLERSKTILVEISNAAPAAGHFDISYEQDAAEQLLEANRLYRQTAASTGDASTAALLDDLERALVEIAHSPSSVSAQQMRALRGQIEDRGLLFKVKVFGSQAANQGNSL